jgi:FtsP/CotA-like multicopper oxidase with cupredoxin domain
MASPLFRIRRSVLAATFALAIAASVADGQTLQPAGWDTGVRLREAADANPDPHVVEITLEARVARVEIAEGVSLDAWTYNGGVPGPLIRVRVGDRLVVHFVNTLPQPTTVHWHGLRIPIQMDGVPDVSQPAVKPGERFTYDFTVPDAGLFWYHPHVMSAEQVGFGLYGALLVEDPAEQRTVGVADELVMVLSDMSIVPAGTLEPADAGGSIGTVFGREGSHVLLNGREKSALTVRSGAPQRWRIVNTAKSRYFQLDLGGLPFRQIGTDGGLQEFAVDQDTLVLAPGERADVIVVPLGTPATPLTLKSLLFYRGFGTVEGRFPFDDLATIAFGDGAPFSGGALPAVRRAIEPIAKAGATAVDLEFVLVQAPDQAPEYQISGARFDAKTKTIAAKLGETQIWTIVNKSSWSHPLHLHGFFFQVLDANGEPVRPLAWKDTVNIPYDSTLRLIVRYDDDRPGDWMVHCHILDHAEGGLMGSVRVGRDPRPVHRSPGEGGSGPDAPAHLHHQPQTH